MVEVSEQYINNITEPLEFDSSVSKIVYHKFLELELTSMPPLTLL